MKQQFPTGKAPQLVIEDCKGSLTIRPHDQPVVLVSGGQAEVTQDESGDVLTITSQTPLSIRAPHQTELLIRNVYGSAVVKGIHNQVTIENARGSLNCRNVGTLIVKSVYGGFSAREVDSTVTIGEVHGDVSVRNSQDVSLKHIQGDFIARNVHGTVEVGHSDGDVVLRNISGDINVTYCDRDVSLRNVAGQVQVSEVHGDIRLREGLPPGDHLLRAEGDIVVRWPLSTPVNLQATGRTVRNHLPLVAWPIATKEGDTTADLSPDEQIEQLKAAEQEVLKIELEVEDEAPDATEPEMNQENGRAFLRGRLGDGDCNLTLESDADIILRGLGHGRGDDEDEASTEFEMDFGFMNALEHFGEQMAGLGEVIANEVNTKFAERMANMSSELETELGSKYADQMASKAERAVERAMRKTEQALKRMQRQAAYASPPPPPRPPQTPPAPHSAPQQTAAEKATAQVKILEMLQNGKISVEEANTLLKALE